MATNQGTTQQQSSISSASSPPPFQPTTKRAYRPCRYTPIGDTLRTATWDVPISHTDRAKMLHGFWPQDMDDKWVLFAEARSPTEVVDDGTTEAKEAAAAAAESANSFVLRICRSWSDGERIVVTVETKAETGAGDSGEESIQSTWRISQVEWKRGAAWLGDDASKEEEEPEIKSMVRGMCRGFLGCELEALNTTDEEEEEEEEEDDERRGS